MRDRSQKMPGAIFVCFIFTAAIIWVGILRIKRIAPVIQPESHETGSIESTNTSWASLKIDVNSANASRIELLPGIGPHLAQRIIDYRRENGIFLTLDDLQQVRGLGMRSVERLRPYAVAGADQAFGIAKNSPKQVLDADSSGTYKEPIQD